MFNLYIIIYAYSVYITSHQSHLILQKSCQQTKPAKRQIVSDWIVFNLGQPPESIAFTATEKSALSPIVVLSVGTFYMWYFRKKLL